MLDFQKIEIQNSIRRNLVMSSEKFNLCMIILGIIILLAGVIISFVNLAIINALCRMILGAALAFGGLSVVLVFAFFS